MRGPYSSPLCFSAFGSLKSINNVRSAPLMSKKTKKKRGALSLGSCPFQLKRHPNLVPGSPGLNNRVILTHLVRLSLPPHCSLIFLPSASHGNDSPHPQKASSELHFCKSDMLINEDLRLPHSHSHPPQTLSLSAHLGLCLRGIGSRRCPRRGAN